MKKIIFLLLLFPATLLAQRKQGKLFIDSLFQELPKQRTDSDKINLLNEISFAYGLMADYNKGLHNGQLALHLAETKKWNKGHGFAYFNIGYNYTVKGNVDSALIYFNLASEVNKIIINYSLKTKLYYGYGIIQQSKLQSAKALDYYQMALNQFNQYPDKTLRGLILINCGNIWNALSNPLKALEFFHKAVQLGEEVNDYNLIAMAYGNLGNVYFYFDPKQAILNYQRSLAYYRLLDSKKDVASELCNIGLVEANLSEYDKALEHHHAALNLYRQIGAYSFEGVALGNIGYVYDNIGDYPKAREYYMAALFIDRSLGYTSTMFIDDLNGLGNIYNKMQDSDMVKIGELPSSRNNTALNYAFEGLALAREARMADKLSDAWKLLHEIYEREHNIPKAYDAYKNYIVFRDSNVNMANNQELTRRDMQFGFDKQQLSDSLKNEETKRIARFKLQKQRTYTYGAFAGVGMLVLLSFFIFKNYHTQKKSNKLLALEKNKSDSLLLNILPAEVAEQLKNKGFAEAKHFNNVTVFFSDFVNFTTAAEKMTPQELVTELDNCFTAFDEIVGKYNIEKIKTIGDAYMAVCGLPAGNKMHAQNIMMAALEIRNFMKFRNNDPESKSFNIRIGIHSGSVVAGIVGTKKFAYDIWGDAVNTAARMEQNSEKGMINISEKSYDLVKDEFDCTYRGELDAKNKGRMKMYFLESKKDIRSA